MIATGSIPHIADKPFTDYTRWRLKSDSVGNHTWHYLRTDEECKEWPQNNVDKFWLGLPTNLPRLPRAKDALGAARNGFEFLKQIQCDDGHWAGEYGGPMFLLPGLVIGSYITGMWFAEEERLEMIRYIMNRAHPEDGGWGIHVESPSTVFGTSLNYTALRLLGMEADHPVATKARGILHKLGGATGVPSWGKFWLSLLNVYDWDGNNPVPPELWLLPEWLPIHPHRWWIHTRNIYIPMSYLYGHRFKMEENELILSLREELYTENYYSIDWPAQRNNIAEVDNYAPHTRVLNGIYVILGAYESCVLPPARQIALQEVYKLIVQEDTNTTYQTLGPVGKMFNLVCRFHAEGTESKAYRLHELKRKEFMWVGREGMMMCGTNGSQLWDIGFTTQAVVESGLAEEKKNKDAMVKVLKWLDMCQIRDNPPYYESAYRHTTKGAWPFSTKEQGYTVSDCTGEGLKSVLYLQNRLNFPKIVSDRRLFDAVDVILSMQNSNGGFASYELIRGPAFLELINPAEVFGNIMIEYSYPECTTSALTGLSVFKKYYPDYRRREIESVSRKAQSFLHKIQRPEGGWYGSWGVCFTYATMFALESLALLGETYETSDTVRKACHFLLSKQRADGGWSESYKSCETEVYTENADSQVVQTSWAAMALMYAHYPERRPIEHAVQLVMSRQLSDGSWAQEAIEGVFNKNCAIAYPNFKFSFTTWMLGKAHFYLQQLEKYD